MPTIDDLIARVHEYDPAADEGVLRHAYTFAEEAHHGQMRVSGEPYVTHCLATAMILAEMRMPPTIIIAGLLHDVPEDTQRTLEDIRVLFGDDVASIVGSITKLGKLKYRGMERYIENLRKMFLAMAADVRVVIVKFADRLHNLETLDAIPPKKQYRIALESLDLFAPIANRLGMGEMRGKIEGLSFKYVYPKEYVWTVDIERATREGKTEYLEQVIARTRMTLLEAGIQHTTVHGRAKHLYSLYRKLLKHARDIERIHDLMAVRVVVPT